MQHGDQTATSRSAATLIPRLCDPHPPIAALIIALGMAATLWLAGPAQAATFEYLSEPVDVSPSGTNAWPKSNTLTVPSSRTLMFAGFRSR